MADYVRLHSGFHNEVLRKWQTTSAVITKYNLIYPIFVT